VPRRRTLFAAALALVALTACTAPSGPGADTTGPTPSASSTPVGEVVVYVPGALAAQTGSLTEAFAGTGLGTVAFEVGHTPVQREQLAQGAAPDVWIAANPADMSAAADAGHVEKAGVQPLARTKLVVVIAPGNPGAVSTLDDLARPGLKLLLGADTIPIGSATGKTLDKLEAARAPGFRAAVEANVVSRELGVSPIVTKVSMGEADAGIVFVTDAGAAGEGVTTLAIPDADNTFVPLSIAPVVAGKNQAGAAVFIEFVTAGAGYDLLTEAGFLPPES